MTTTTPKTDLELYQAMRIEALEKHVAYQKAEIDKAKTILSEILEEASQIEVKDERYELGN